MIDEKKLIENLEKEWEELCDYSENVETLLEYVARFIAEQPKISNWIPCSERLPTKEESIKNDNRFILDDGNRRYGGLFDYEKQCFVQFDFWKGLVEDKCVIAWQPLPEVYHE